MSSQLLAAVVAEGRSDSVALLGVPDGVTACHGEAPFAPSSLRKTSEPVLETDAERRFNLRPQHWEKAREIYLYDKRVPIVAVAAFMLRDYGFVSASEPTTSDLIEAFREYWGYTDQDEIEVEYLFDTEWSGTAGGWFTGFSPGVVEV